MLKKTGVDLGGGGGGGLDPPFEEILFILRANATTGLLPHKVNC